MGLISIVALLGWLVLALSAYRSHRVSGRKTLVMAATWGAIFLLLAGMIAAVGV